MMSNSGVWPFCVAAIFVVLALGCRSEPTTFLSGTVTVDGELLDYGALTIVSNNGETTGFGSKIDQGKYVVSNIVPGRFKATITAGVRHVGAQVASSGDGKILADQGQSESSFQQIPSNASGNGVDINIAPGENTFNFKIVTKR